MLNGEMFYTLKEAQIIIERWRREYNTIRPHSSLNYRPPAPEAVQPLVYDFAWKQSKQKNMGLALT